jgi:signal transduction histidine kinase
VAVVPYLLPDGRPSPGWPRWGARVGVVAAVVGTLAWLVSPYDGLDEPSSAALALDATNPVGVPGAAWFVLLGLVLTLGAGLGGLASLVHRWRRGEERRPLAWVTAAVGATAFLVALSLSVPGGSPALLALAVVLLPAAVVVGAAASTARLDGLLRVSEARLAVAQEEERRRLRHDLHDSLGPALAGVALQLEALPADIESDPEQASRTAARLTARVSEAVEEVRRLVDGLGPDGSLGLAEALRNEVAGFDAPTLRSTLELDPHDVRDLPAAVEVVALRVVREALANAARHARGDRCTVTVCRDAEHLLVRVRDNGVGLPTGGRPGGVGLISMRSVAQQVGGSCWVGGAAGGGTEVRLALPLGPA